MAKEELLLKVGIDTETETTSDIISLILELINTANDNGFHVIDATIGDELVFERGFKGRLQKK